MAEPDEYLCLFGGTVVDPVQSEQPFVADLWIRRGQICAVPVDTTQSSIRRIDCTGRVIMAGGIDMHSHIVGPKVNVARKMQPQLFQSQTLQAVGQPRPDSSLAASHTLPGYQLLPPAQIVGERYLSMGYTTVMDAAVSPSASRWVHRELEQLTGVDVGFFALSGNHHFLMECAAQGDVRSATEFLGWMLERCGAFAPKLVNPGGIELWKQRRTGNARDLHQSIDGFNTTPAAIIEHIARAANELKLPHPLHIHGNNLGLPGNWQTTLETMRILEGQRAHLAHIQFHSYGGGDEQESSLYSQVQPLADWVNQHPELSVDVGQVLFGQTTSMTADAPLGYLLSRLDDGPWYSQDGEHESGCGVSPIRYSHQRRVNALQWLIGLEWFLSVRDPWQIALTTDHPNGGSFLAYPQIIRLLMDNNYRQESIRQLTPAAWNGSPLLEMTREYTLSEIAVITRAGPAKLLGLHDRGHLRPGAVADVCVYNPQENYQQMFESPWLVIKSGRVARLAGDTVEPEIGEPVAHRSPVGETLMVKTQRDRERDSHFIQWIDRQYSIPSWQFGADATVGAYRRVWRPIASQ